MGEKRSVFDTDFTDIESFDVDFGAVTVVERGDREHYSGNYEVTPQLEDAVVLETAERIMDSNVRVKQIPLHEVSNGAGGKTLTIGQIGE